mmetsp:Transcript_28976/g.51804  ORF Transcript_28976/g.51804 Transcript_28976/m.51804 type:complete len:209 (-) Transcript_28976:43-669(-)
MIPRGFGENAEQKLKLQIFFISTGLFMLVSSMLFDTWFYFQGVAFSVNALNSHNILEVTNYRHECATLLSYSAEFVCFCNESACDILKQVNFAGWLYILAIIVSLPFYVCIIANVNRKIERIPLNFDLERDCFDWEAYHYIAPSIVTVGFLAWLLVVFKANPSTFFGDSQLTLGPAFTNAALGLIVLIGNMLHYMLSVKKTYRAELTS